MARRQAGLFPRDRHVHHDFLRIVRSMFRYPHDDPTRDEFLALAHFFVRVHDDSRLHRRLDRIQSIQLTTERI